MLHYQKHCSSEGTCISIAITCDFRTIMSNNGEKLDSDELEQAFDGAVNPVTGVVDLERYAGRLLYNSKLFKMSYFFVFGIKREVKINHDIDFTKKMMKNYRNL